MKMITPGPLLRALREGRDEVHVDPDLAERGRRAVQRMIEIGQPGGGGVSGAGERRWEAGRRPRRRRVRGRRADRRAGRRRGSGLRVVVVTKDAADAGHHALGAGRHRRRAR